MAHSTVPTVTINHPGGYCIINASDFDPSLHTLYVKPEISPEESRVIEDATETAKEEAVVAAAEPVAEQLPSDVARLTGEPVIPDFSAGNKRKR